jgi:uncharacterized protein
LHVQFTREHSDANIIHSWEPGRIRVRERWMAGHVIISRDELIHDWPVTVPEELTVAELEPAIAMAPQIILLGTGMGDFMPDLELMSELAQRAIGLEVMSTPAACRTYNVLVHEHREVVAALFNGPPTSASNR